MAPISQFVNRVICGDSIKVMAAMPTASVDLIITDPPYGARYRDRSGRAVANDDNLAWLTPAFREAARVVKDDRFVISFYGWQRAGEFLAAWKAAGLYPLGHFVWTKDYASNARSSSRYLAYHHECAYLLGKHRPPCPPLLLADVLPWNYTGNRRHPTEKPVSGIRPLIEAFSRPGGIVLDPFAGSGTTAAAAKSAGRRYIAIELEPQYCDIARDRLLQVGAEKSAA